MTTRNVALDPVESRALAKAIERLPAQAVGNRCQPLTPSLRAVLDRFLSAPLRAPLRSLGSAGGPVAVAIDGLAIGTADAIPTSGPDPTEAVAMWLLEAAGLFPAPGQPPAPTPTRSGPPLGQQLWSDHVLLLVRAQPSTEATTIRCAPLDDALAALDPASVDILARSDYRPAGEAEPGRSPGQPHPVLAPIGSAMALGLDPRLVVGVEPEAERARDQLLAALDAAVTTIGLAVGTGVLANRRRCLIDTEHAGSWLRRMDLVIDPWSTDAGPGNPDQAEHRGGDRS